MHASPPQGTPEHQGVPDRPLQLRSSPGRPQPYVPPLDLSRLPAPTPQDLVPIPLRFYQAGQCPSRAHQQMPPHIVPAHQQMPPHIVSVHQQTPPDIVPGHQQINPYIVPTHQQMPPQIVPAHQQMPPQFPQQCMGPADPPNAYATFQSRDEPFTPPPGPIQGHQPRGPFRNSSYPFDLDLRAICDLLPRTDVSGIGYPFPEGNYGIETAVYADPARRPCSLGHTPWDCTWRRGIDIVTAPSWNLLLDGMPTDLPELNIPAARAWRSCRLPSRLCSALSGICTAYLDYLGPVPKYLLQSSICNSGDC
jgi:hypothetical protein